MNVNPSHSGMTAPTVDADMHPWAQPSSLTLQPYSYLAMPRNCAKC